MTTIRVLFALALIAAVAPVNPALADASDDAADTPVCRKGHVYDTATKKCVREEQSSLDDRGLLQNAKALAYAGRHGEARRLLLKISDKRDPEVLNYLGYTTRNTGDLKAGLSYYRQAIALNGDYVLARSYMGQALLIAGDRRGAMVQLDEIASRAGTDGRAYRQLALALMQKSLVNSPRY